jgi:probable rRNA maturation factor
MISVGAFFPCRAIRISRREVERCVAYVCAKEKRNKASVTIVFTDDKDMRRINKKHLGHDSATDVVSFTLEDAPLEGEVYIDLQQARRQAVDFSVTPLNEATRLLVHGVLHLCGYDDTTDRAKTTMIEKQERYVAALRDK